MIVPCQWFSARLGQPMRCFLPAWYLATSVDTLSQLGWECCRHPISRCCETVSDSAQDSLSFPPVVNCSTSKASGAESEKGVLQSLPVISFYCLSAHHVWPVSLSTPHIYIVDSGLTLSLTLSAPAFSLCPIQVPWPKDSCACAQSLWIVSTHHALLTT